jgi:hypothetical protein
MLGLTPMQMPVELPIWGLANLKVTRVDLPAMLGEPHFVETDPRRTCGGERDAWAFRLPSGQRVLVILDVTVEIASLFGDPPEFGPLIQAFGLSPSDARLSRLPVPWELR